MVRGDPAVQGSVFVEILTNLVKVQLFLCLEFTPTITIQLSLLLELLSIAVIFMDCGRLWAADRGEEKEKETEKDEEKEKPTVIFRVSAHRRIPHY